MCAPLVVMAVMAAAAAASAAAAVQSNRNAQAEAKSQQKLLDANAKVEEGMANDTRNRGTIAEGDSLAQTDQFMGTQRSAIAASGLRLDSGTPLDVLAGTQAQGNVEARNISGNYQREAFGQSVQSWNSRAGARMAGARASNIGAAMPLTLLGGALNVASSGGQGYYMGSQMKASSTAAKGG